MVPNKSCGTGLFSGNQENWGTLSANKISASMAQIKETYKGKMWNFRPSDGRHNLTKAAKTTGLYIHAKSLNYSPYF